MNLQKIPTPISGLALGISSVGWCLDNAINLNGNAQVFSSLLAFVLLVVVLAKFIVYPSILQDELTQPVVGSIIPTFAMAWMVVSKSINYFSPIISQIIWLSAIGIYLIFVAIFSYHRALNFNFSQLIPSWFVPPIGIIVACVTIPNDNFLMLTELLLCIGLVNYFMLLPLMIYRFIFYPEIPDSAKPTIAIMAAPASLSLAGYLTITPEPSLIICALLSGIAILMTTCVYVSFFKLLRLPFSPGYAAFTFPLAIGATALYKLSDHLKLEYHAIDYAQKIRWIAHFELIIALIMITYVTLHYINFLIINCFNSKRSFLK